MIRWVVAACLAICSGCATSPPSTTPPDRLGGLRSLTLLVGEDPQLDILYAHGMGANGPHGGEWLVAQLCGDWSRREPAAFSDEAAPDYGGCVRGRERFDLSVGSWADAETGAGLPPEVTFLGERVWDEATWKAARPYLMRIELAPPGRNETVVVHELNWWPLVQPLKCKFMIGRDSRLTGAQSGMLEVCGQAAPPWPAEIPPGGDPRGAAKLNRLAKSRLLNWGIADAVIKTGPMDQLLDETVVKAVLCMAGRIEGACEPQQAAAAGGRGRGSAEQYAIVTESLGGFIVFDALAEALNLLDDSRGSESTMALEARTLTDVFDNVDSLFLLANQVSILSLARLAPAPMEAASGPEAGLEALLERQPPSGRPRQVVAFHDPNDLLTYELPERTDANAHVVNVYVRNTQPVLGLIAHPGKAHLDYWKNPHVRHVMFGEAAPGGR